MIDWESLLKFLGGVTGISMALAYIGKKAIEAYLSSRVERYKAELKNLTTEHSIRFQQLHTERANVIKELYNKLIVLDQSLVDALRGLHPVGNGIPTLEDKVNALGKAHYDLYEFYVPKKIYFEKKICELLDSIVENSRGVFLDITLYPVDPKDTSYKYDRELLSERHVFWQKARETYKTTISELKKTLEDEFRRILGINI